MFSFMRVMFFLNRIKLFTPEDLKNFRRSFEITSSVKPNIKTFPASLIQFPRFFYFIFEKSSKVAYVSWHRFVNERYAKLFQKSGNF